MVKHFGADRVGVIWRETTARSGLIVEDDGKVFDHGDRVRSYGTGIQHLGLIGVRERLALVGAIGIGIKPNGGTTIFVRIPLRPALALPARILMVDDHPVVLAGLKALVGADLASRRRRGA